VVVYNDILNYHHTIVFLLFYDLHAHVLHDHVLRDHHLLYLEYLPIC
jgi:hypothetical protein